MAFASKCALNLPFPNATTDKQHYENYKEIQRWSDRLLRTDEGCIEGGCTSEAFRYDDNQGVVTAGNSADPIPWRTAGAAQFTTSGVSMSSGVLTPPYGS